VVRFIVWFIVWLFAVYIALIIALVSLATIKPLAPSRLVSLYVLLVEPLAGPEVVLLIRA
jgi:hypothetical protein